MSTAPKRLGVVALNGAVYFRGELEECREYLRGWKLVQGPFGWAGRTYRGAIYFNGGAGDWTAAVWRLGTCSPNP